MRKKITIPLLTMVIFRVVVCSLISSPAVAISQELDYCQRLNLELRDIKSVMERKKLLEYSILECPDDALLLYYYAVNLDRLQQYEKALHYYQLSAKQDSLFPYVYFGMGEAYFAMGNTVEAINIYKKGLAIHPDNKWGEMRLTEIINSCQEPDNPKVDHQDITETSGEDQTSKNKQLADIAGKYNIKLNELTQISRQADNPEAGHQDTTETSREDQISKNKQLANIAGKYDIKLDDLIRSSQQMDSMKIIGNRYGLRIEDLIKASQKSSPQPQAQAQPQEVQKMVTIDNKKPVLSGEKDLNGIAARYGIKVKEIQTLINQMTAMKKIADRYGIPLSQLMQTENKPKIFNSKDKLTNHTVHINEDLSQIAERYGISLEKLIQANKLPDPNKIFPGQVIKIPVKAQP